MDILEGGSGLVRDKRPGAEYNDTILNEEKGPTNRTKECFLHRIVRESIARVLIEDFVCEGDKGNQETIQFDCIEKKDIGKYYPSPWLI